MKKISPAKIVFIVFIVFSLFIFQASAALDPAVVKNSADSLVKLGILYGDSKGNLKLQDKIKRCEFVTLVLPMMGLAPEEDESIPEVKFKDLSKKHWAYRNLQTAVDRNLLTGYSDNTIRPDQYITLAEAEVILIKALGYESTLKGEWPDKVTNKSAELGLDKDLKLSADKVLTRGETAVLVYNSLTVKFN